MKTQLLLTNFSGGELSPRLEGRVDIKKFATGCRVIENFQVLSHGGARKRPGTRFVVEQKNVGENVVLVPFQYNIEQTYMLAFGPSYVWFLKDRAPITFAQKNITAITRANPCQVTSAAHGLIDGVRVILTGIGGMAELNNRQFQVSGATTNTFNLMAVDSTGYTTYTSGGQVGQIVELETRYTSDELADLTFAQSTDTLYIAHKNHPLRKIQRSSNTAWTLSTPTITTGPFRSINPDRSFTITPSSFSGSVTSFGTHIVGETCTLTASSAVFQTGMVGGLFRLTEEGGATGIGAAPVGNSSRSLAVGDTYTNAGNIYGVTAVVGTATWQPYGRVPDHDAGTVRVQSGANYFDSSFLHPGYCIVRITLVSSPTSAQAEIVRYSMPKSIITSGTSFWEEGAWSDYRGYARAVSFYEQRLFMAGSLSDPSVVWSSRSNEYESFEDGTVDNAALVYRISAGSADVIRWLSPGRVLTAGSSAGEFVVSASNLNEALTPKNFKATTHTTYGTSSAQPVRINQAVLYPQRSGNPINPAKKLREFAYDYASDQFNSVDMTIFSEHIFGTGGFKKVSYQLEPDSFIWCTRVDGSAAVCTYERPQEIVAWHRHVLGGTGAKILTTAVSPGDVGDELWLSVERTINGQTVRNIEVLMPAFNDAGVKEDAVLLDCSLTYTGTATSTISGLWHLRGESVKVLNNGAVETVTVGADGRITLAKATTKAHIGYGYKAILETQDLEGGAQAGTAQSRAKRISQVYVRLLSSLGGSIGPDAEHMKPLHFRTPQQPMGSSPPLFSGLIALDFNGGWERYARVRIEHDDPLPFHVGGVVAELSTTG